jgi:hypothetical protein
MMLSKAPLGVQINTRSRSLLACRTAQVGVLAAKNGWDVQMRPPC